MLAVTFYQPRFASLVPSDSMTLSALYPMQQVCSSNMLYTLLHGNKPSAQTRFPLNAEQAWQAHCPANSTIAVACLENSVMYGTYSRCLSPLNVVQLGHVEVIGVLDAPLKSGAAAKHHHSQHKAYSTDK